MNYFNWEKIVRIIGKTIVLVVILILVCFPIGYLFSSCGHTVSQTKEIAEYVCIVGAIVFLGLKKLFNKN